MPASRGLIFFQKNFTWTWLDWLDLAGLGWTGSDSGCFFDGFGSAVDSEWRGHSRWFHIWNVLSRDYEGAAPDLLGAGTIAGQ